MNNKNVIKNLSSISPTANICSGGNDLLSNSEISFKSEKELLEYAEKHNVIYIETSFGTGDNEPAYIFMSYKDYKRKLNKNLKGLEGTKRYVKKEYTEGIEQLQNKRIEIEKNIKMINSKIAKKNDIK